MVLILLSGILSIIDEVLLPHPYPISSNGLEGPNKLIEVLSDLPFFQDMKFLGGNLSVLEAPNFSDTWNDIARNIP